MKNIDERLAEIDRKLSAVVRSQTMIIRFIRQIESVETVEEKPDKEDTMIGVV